MARRGRSSDDVDTRPAPLNAPFQDLRKRWRTRPAPPAPVQPKAPPPPPVTDDRDLFASAMTDVVPLPRGRDRVDVPPPAAGHGRPVSEEAEALAALSDLVTGVTHF